MAEKTQARQPARLDSMRIAKSTNCPAACFHAFPNFLCVFHPLQNCARTPNFWRRVNRKSKMASSGWISTKCIE